MKMETLQQRRDELERKEQRLKESLLKFDKFLKVRVLAQIPGSVCVCVCVGGGGGGGGGHTESLGAGLVRVVWLSRNPTIQKQ